ncbi:MAG: hypothetical protein AB8B91_16295 [Rubripirellula sp.]
MSTEAPEDAVNVDLPNGDQTSALEWDSFCQSLRQRTEGLNAKKVLGKSCRSGAIYRWGMAAASGAPCSPITERLSRLACVRKPWTTECIRDSGLVESVDVFIESCESKTPLSAVDAFAALLWGAALPGLVYQLRSTRWFRLYHAVVRLRQRVLEQENFESPVRLLVGAELGLTLAWRLGELTDIDSIASSAEIALEEWFDQSDAAISGALADGGQNSRLVLASLIRSQRILAKIGNRKLSQCQLETVETLATWVAALTTHHGDPAFVSVGPDALADDLADRGLLQTACEFNSETLRPALEAALGETPSGGRLAWEVSLPVAFYHDELAQTAVMFPDWDVRRGRTHLDYSSSDVRLEVYAGRTQVIGGAWKTQISLDEVAQRPNGDWGEVCHFSDDDIHYLEIEQPWTGDIVLQRHVMLIRDDRCLMIADTVLPAKRADQSKQKINYVSQIPLAAEAQVEEENETRELFVCDQRQRQQAMVMPLSASEWKIGPSDAAVQATKDHLQLSTSGTGRLFAPLWFDFQRRRFNRKRTWRDMTIGDQLRIVPRNEAVGYRVQVGSEQWMLYRSLAPCACRTVLGKHLNADFFASRFDTGDGGHEVLVTVDDTE